MARAFLTLVGFSALVALAPAAPVPKHLFPKGHTLSFPTHVGTTWAYDGDYGELTISISKVEEKGGTLFVATESVSEGGQRTPHEVRRISADGVFVVAEQGVKFDEPWCLLKLPHREGQTWMTELRGHGPPGVGTMRAGPVEKVKVPAGEFSAVRVDWEFKNKLGGRITATYWYADGVGLVRMDERMKLKSFTPGK